MQAAPTPRLTTTTPWHAQRWPWLLMLGPAVVLVAGVSRPTIAESRTGRPCP